MNRALQQLQGYIQNHSSELPNDTKVALSKRSSLRYPMPTSLEDVINAILQSGAIQAVKQPIRAALPPLPESSFQPDVVRAVVQLKSLVIDVINLGLPWETSSQAR